MFNTFLVPQWGGIIIYNHDNDTTTVLMEQVMDTIIKQLELLLGIEDYKVQSLYTLPLSLSLSLPLSPSPSLYRYLLHIGVSLCHNNNYNIIILKIINGFIIMS